MKFGKASIKRRCRAVTITLGRLILALVKFCDFEIFRLSMYFNLANSLKISELEKWFLTWYLANVIAHASN